MKFKFIYILIIFLLLLSFFLPQFFKVFSQNDLDLDKVGSNMRKQEKPGQLAMLDFRLSKTEDKESSVLEIIPKI